MYNAAHDSDLIKNQTSTFLPISKAVQIGICGKMIITCIHRISSLNENYETHRVV